MMKIKYDIEIDNEAIKVNLKRLTNQVYKLLPIWEEANDWRKPLNTIIIEFVGMRSLLENHQVILFSLLCKLEGLNHIVDEDQESFFLFRKTIFESLGLINDLGKRL